MANYVIQYTNQADQDIDMILCDFRDSISGENAAYRQRAVSLLLKSIDLREIFRSVSYDEDGVLQTTSTLNTIIPGIRMLRTKFGHCIFFRYENNLLTVVRVIDGRAPYIVLCENLLSLKVPDNRGT